MVRDLERQNRLDQAVLEAQETTGDLLYELVSVKKMNYPAAWELATQEWALPQSGNQEETTSGDLPPPPNPSGTSTHGNSTSATSHRGARRSAARLPDNRGPPDRAGRAEGKSPR
jgi:hypothetical protein